MYTLGSGSTEIPTVREYDLAENEYVGRTKIAMAGDMDVKVTMDGDKISAIEFLFEHETQGVGTVALEQMPPKIFEANSTEVDAVAGATMTSLGILDAVNDALAQIA